MSEAVGIVGIMDTNSINDVTDTVSITLRIPNDLRRRIRVLAAEEDKSAQQWMREALELVVERVEASRGTS